MSEQFIESSSSAEPARSELGAFSLGDASISAAAPIHLKVREVGAIIGKSPTWILKHREHYGVVGHGRNLSIPIEAVRVELARMGRDPASVDHYIERLRSSRDAPTEVYSETHYSRVEFARLAKIPDHRSITASLYTELGALRDGKGFWWFPKDKADAYLESKDIADPLTITGLARLLGRKGHSLHFYLRQGDLLAGEVTSNSTRLDPANVTEFVLTRFPRMAEGVLKAMRAHRSLGADQGLERDFETEVRGLGPILSGQTHYSEKRTCELLGYKDMHSFSAAMLARLPHLRMGREVFFERAAVDQELAARAAAELPDPRQVSGLMKILEVSRGTVYRYYAEGPIKHAVLDDGSVRMEARSVAEFVLAHHPRKAHELMRAMERCGIFSDDADWCSGFKSELKRIEPIISGRTYYSEDRTCELLGYTSRHAFPDCFAEQIPHTVVGREFFFERVSVNDEIARRALAEVPDPRTIAGLARITGSPYRRVHYDATAGKIISIGQDEGAEQLNYDSVAEYVKCKHPSKLPGLIDSALKHGLITSSDRFQDVLTAFVQDAAQARSIPVLIDEWLISLRKGKISQPMLINALAELNGELRTISPQERSPRYRELLVCGELLERAVSPEFRDDQL